MRDKGHSHIIIVHLYQLGTAATNRIVAYAKSFASFGQEVTLVLGSNQIKPLLELGRVDVKVVTAPCHSLLFPNMAKAVKRIYTNNSSILVYGSPLLCLFLPKSRYRIFYECTEIPLYGRTKGEAIRIKEAFKMYLAKRASGMLVISQALRDFFYQKGIKNIEVVNMFVDATRFEIQDKEKSIKYIAYCGTVSPFKDGVDCLIKAFDIFHKKHSEYRLKIIGRFESPEAENVVRNLARDLGLSDCIDFTGIVMPDEMPELLQGASMLALARPNNLQAQFGFPTKLGEYLATGNPVVVTNVGEIGVFLHDGENCRMAKPGDAEDFAEKMIWVAENQEASKIIGTRGKELTRTEFSAIEQSKKALSFMNAIR